MSQIKEKKVSSQLRWWHGLLLLSLATPPVVSFTPNLPEEFGEMKWGPDIPVNVLKDAGNVSAQCQSALTSLIYNPDPTKLLYGKMIMHVI